MAELLAGYAFQTLLPALPDAPRSLDARPLASVPAAFERLRTAADDIVVHAADGPFPPHRYTSTAQDQGRGFIHFQGIQRLRDGRYGMVTGGDSLQPAAHAFLFRLESRYVRGPWGSNVVKSNRPPAEDAVVSAVAVGREHWHAGGFGLLGDIAVIPLEHDSARSKTVFFDLSDPLAPRPLPFDLTGPSPKAGAAALTRLPGGRFLCLVYRDEKVKKHDPTGFLDFYLSRSDDLFEGFPDAPFATVHYGDVENRDGRLPGYQNVQFLIEGDPREPATWTLYLAGTWNGSSMSPTIPGPNWADLHLVTLDTRMFDDVPPDNLLPPHLRRIASRRFGCRDCFGNFDAAAGFHVDERGALLLYSAFHWRFDGTLLIAEFREQPPADLAPITQIQDAWVDLYEHPDFQGRRLSIIGLKDEDLPDYDRISVQGSTFEDKVSSARWQVPEGRVYRLFERRGFDDRGRTLDLAGDGAVHEIANFRKLSPKFNDVVSSSRYISVPEE